MKKIVFAAFIAVVSMSFVVPVVQKTVRGSGRVAYGEFDISQTYAELSVARGIRVVLTDSKTGVGKIAADEELLRHVSITERDGVVRVTYTPSTINPRSDVETVVTMPMSTNLRDLNVSSAGKIESVVPVKAREVEIDGSSAGRVKVPVESASLSVELSSAAGAELTIESGDVEVDLSSAADCRMSGRARGLNVETSSAANFRGEGFTAERVEARASSGGGVQVSATESIDARASSGGSVRYSGNPSHTNFSSSSGGSVRKVD